MGSFKHLSEFERGKIELMWKQGHKQASIARELNRSRSTISREIIRSQEYQDYERYSPKRRQHTYWYNALIAQNNARYRKLKIGRNTKLTYEMKDAIISCIERNYHKKVYFTHAYAPQERGTNENTNGLIRAYLPKKQMFESQSQSDMIYIATQLNNRPNKVHGFKTCAEIFKNEVLKLQGADV